MGKKKKSACPYGECSLPENNNKYWFQAGYLAVSVLVLLSDVEEFTFFSLMLFTAPILFDLISTTLEGNLYKGVAKLYIIMNSLVVVFCLSGVCGFFTDEGNTFVVSNTALICAGKVLEKEMLVWPMISELVIPYLMYNGCPNQRTKKIMEIGREYRKDDKG